MPGQKIEVFNPDAILTLKMSVPFYQRIQSMMLTLTQEHKPEEVKVAIDRIKADVKGLLPWEEMLQTILIMIYNIEDQARKEGYLTLQDVKSSQST
jgi:flagellar motor component MotA